MFDVGFWEILLILILALVVIGPERLPGAARKAGYFVGKARRYIEGVRTEVESEFDLKEFKRLLHNQEVQINELQSKIKSSVDDVTSATTAATQIEDSHIEDTETHSFHDEHQGDGEVNSGDNNVEVEQASSTTNKDKP